MHTPGPWTIVTYGDGDSLVIHSDDENRVCFMATHGGSRAQWERIQANAALIAAAPDLYEALSPVLRGADEADYYCPDDVADDHTVLVSFTIAELRAARAALSKLSQQQGSDATGSPQADGAKDSEAKSK